MPNPKEARALRMSSEGGVALEQKLCDRCRVARFEFFAAEVPFINQPTLARLDAAPKRLAIVRVVVVDAAKMIRQTEAARAEADAQRIRKPFREEIDSGLTLMADISADVEKFVGGDRLEKPFAETPANSWPHSRQRERDNADKSAAVPQVEFERHIELECSWLGLVMDEDCAIP